MTAGADPAPQGVEVTETVPAALAGQRIDRVVALIADVSRNEAVALIAEGQVRINDRIPKKASERVELEDVLHLEVPERSVGLEEDPAVALSVVFVDDHVVVIDKPAGLVVHPGSGTPAGTLVNGLLVRFPEIREVGEPDRPGIVHRLDKGTSGLMMVARTDLAYESLVTQLQQRTVVRRYRTATEGAVASDEGLIDAPLGRSPRQPTRRAVVVDGRPARTTYRVERRFEHASVSLLACRLETGRTHQIRAHLAAIGHPVVGDTAYDAQPHPQLTRPFLHAELLGFEHPASGEQFEFSSALPDDLADAVSRWEAGQDG